MRPRPRTRHPGARATGAEAGFTMIEIMVVILILGMMVKIVISNAGAWIPQTAVSAQANKFRSWVDYLRSEAKLQGKPYSIELDLDNNMTRVVLPPEDKLVTTEDDTVATTIPLGWNRLDERVRFHGHAASGRQIHTKGKVMITFDENGFTADQAVFFSYDEEDSKLVWTVQIRGLSGSSKILSSREGERHPIPVTEQSNF